MSENRIPETVAEAFAAFWRRVQLDSGYEGFPGNLPEKYAYKYYLLFYQAAMHWLAYQANLTEKVPEEINHFELMLDSLAPTEED